MGEGECNLPPKVGGRVLIHRDMIDVGQADAGLVQAVANRLARESGPMLDAAKALLLGSCHQSAVTHQACGGVAVKGIDAQDGYQRPLLAAEATGTSRRGAG